MVKNITTIHLSSKDAIKTRDPTNVNRILSLNFEVPPIEIKNKAILKVANFCHIGGAASHTNSIYLFKIRGVVVNNEKFLYNTPGNPPILATTLNNNRSLYEENEIVLTKQIINNIDVIVDTLSDSGFIEDVLILNGGSDFAKNQILSTTSAISAATISISSVSSGVITGISVINGGVFSSTSVPNIGTSVNGSGAVLVANLTTNVISSITITTAGTGYKAGQTLTITGGGGSGANISIATVGTEGNILTFTITSGGSGYTSTPTLSVTPLSNTTATLTPIMNYGILSNGYTTLLNFNMTLRIEQEEYD